MVALAVYWPTVAVVVVQFVLDETALECLTSSVGAAARCSTLPVPLWIDWEKKYLGNFVMGSKVVCENT